MKKLFRNYKKGNKYIKLLQEFNEQKTREARFLKQIDKLEMVCQAWDYEQKGYPSKILDEFWENAEKYLKGKSLEPILIELQKNRQKLSK